MPDPWAEAVPAPGLAIDHIGIVVRDLAPTLAWLRRRGFLVNDGVPLMGDGAPLGQTSAHCVFDNGYVEISAPTAPDNHLVPLLAKGEGVRILALASTDIAADYDRLGTLAAGPPRPSARTVALRDGPTTARFAWFPLTAVIPGIITAMVQHRDAKVVYAPELRAHPNGARRLGDVLFGGGVPTLSDAGAPDLPQALVAPALPVGIAGFTITGGGAFSDVREGYSMRGLP